MKIEAPITAVTVYPDRARVTRQGATSLESGTHELEIPDLTLQLDPDAVRVSGEGTARVRILGVDVRKAYFTETPSVPAAKLKRQLLEKQDADQVLVDETDLLEEKLQMLKSMSEQAGQSLARGIGRGKIKVTEGTSILSFVSTQHELVSARKREIAVSRRDLAAEIQVLQQELKRIQGARPLERYTAVVGVEVLRPGELVLKLEYTTRGGARWQPLYDLRLLEEGDAPDIELTYLGQVQQSTGEDWLDIDLVLSTARPAVSAQLPELRPWYIHRYEPPRPAARLRSKAAAPPAPAMAQFSAGATLEDTYAEAEEAPALEPIAAEVMQAEVDSSGAAVTFRIPRKVDVPADDTPHKTTVLSLHLTADLDFLTVPKLANEVYRRAEVTNDSNVTLLPGPVTLFYGGDFIGSARVSQVAPGETFETTLGIEDRIKVERELALKEVSKQLIGDRRTIRYAYEIQVQNLLSRAAQLEVGDQLPIAGHENIKVKLEAIDPQPVTENEQGELTWKLALKPQEEQTLRFEFSVSAPRSDTLIGLP